MSSTVEERSRSLLADPVFSVAEAVLLLRILLAVVAFDPQLFDPFGLVKSAVAHVFTAVLAVLLVWLLARHGRWIFAWSPVHIAIGLVVLSFAIASFFAVDHEVALFGTWRRYLGLTQMVDQAVVYAGAVVLVRSRQAVGTAFVVALIAAAIVAAYGLVQFAGLDPFKFADSTKRPISTLGNPDILGGFLSVAVPTLAAVALVARRELPRWSSAAALGVAVACVALMIPVGVRNGVLGIGAGAATAVAVVLIGREPDRRLVLWLTGGAALALAIVFIALGSRLTPAYLQQDPAVEERLEIWRAAVAEVQARPLFGVGPDNFGVVWPSVRTARSEQLIGPDNIENSTHGWPVYYLTSAGLAGLGAFLAAIVLAALAAIRLARRGDPLALAAVPLAAYLAQGLVDVNDVSLDWIPFFAMGLLAGAAGETVLVVAPRSKRARRSASPRPGWVGGVGWAFVTVALVAAAAAALPRVGASRAELLGQTRLNVGAAPEAIDMETDAVQRDPRRAEYWSSLGAALAGVNSVAASSAFVTASEMAPHDRTHWLNISVTQRALGNLGGGIAAARRAVAADPNSSRAHRNLANALLQAERFEEAASEGETALRLYQAPEMYEEPILAYIRLARWDRAVELANAAVKLTSFPHYYLRLAQALHGAGREKDSREALDVVLQQTPKDPEALDLAGVLKACTGVSAAASTPGPQNVGVKVTWTATARGCADPEFRFSLAVPGRGWRMVQDWSSTATFAYAGDAVGGTYTFEVDVRSKASPSNAGGPADNVFGYTFLSDATCSGVSATASPSSPQPRGIPVTWAAIAVGCTKAEFRFFSAAPGGGWQVVRDWSTTPTYTFTAGDTGRYLWEIQVRAVGSSAAYDASLSTSYDVR
jgi:O-antigen ligase